MGSLLSTLAVLCILDAGERAEVREHFLGPVMYLAAVDPLNAHWSPYLVYDGQQRLTTVTLILEALARHLKDDTAPDGFEPAQTRRARARSEPSPQSDAERTRPAIPPRPSSRPSPTPCSSVTNGSGILP